MRKAILLVGLALAGCGTNFAGTYKGPETGTQNGVSFSNVTMTVTLSQDGDSISGTWSSSSGSSGTVSAKASGDKLEGFVATAPSTDSCPGTFSGTLTLTDEVLAGSFSGTSNPCGAINASVSLTKQE